MSGCLCFRIFQDVDSCIELMIIILRSIPFFGKFYTILIVNYAIWFYIRSAFSHKFVRLAFTLTWICNCWNFRYSFPSLIWCIVFIIWWVYFYLSFLRRWHFESQRRLNDIIGIGVVVFILIFVIIFEESVIYKTLRVLLKNLLLQVSYWNPTARFFITCQFSWIT